MIKKLLIVASVALTVTASAQTNKLVNSQGIATELTNLPTSNAKSSSAPGCVLVSTQTGTAAVINTAAPCVTTSLFGGFVNGTNCYGDTEKANYFAASTFSAVTGPTITSVLVTFFKTPGHGTSGTTNTVALNIYNGTMASGPTGAALASVSASLAQLIALSSPTNSSFTYTFNLSTPIVAPATGFFAALTVPNTPGDTVVIVNQSAAPANLGWEKQVPAGWIDMGSANGWGTTYKANLSFYPVICGSNIITGISKNLGLSKDVKIMPNPSTGLVNLTVSLPSNQDLNVTVTNALGQVIVNNNYNSVLSEVIALDLTNQTNGVYFVTVSNGKDKMVQRLIINK